MSKTDLGDVVATFIGAAAGLAIVSIIVIPVGLGILALDAWVATYLWQWFVHPIFHLPLLGVPAAMGIILTWRLFRGQISTYSKPSDDQTPAEKEQNLVQLFSNLISPLAVLGLGWLIQHWWIIQ